MTAWDDGIERFELDRLAGKLVPPRLEEPSDDFIDDFESEGEKREWSLESQRVDR